MEKRLISPIIQFISILVYIILHFGNFSFFFLKLPLGIILLLFIPGYNFINLLFLNFSTKLKIGLCPIFSLGLEILIMLIYYIFGVLIYGLPFFFDINFLVIIFTTISGFLILVHFFKNYNKRKKSNDSIIQNERLQNNFKINRFYILLSGFFIIILILLCLNVYLNRVVLTKSQILTQYSENFTFFYYCDIYFYFLYSAAILLLIFFAFKLKNKFIFLSYICLFLYVQLILPYLQIGNLFVSDAYTLQSWVSYYFNNGFTPFAGKGLTVITNPNINSVWPIRYATSTFYTILLILFSGMDLLFSLCFLYSIIFCFFPFFVYGFFEYVFNKDKKNKKSLMVITLISIFNPFIMKLGHTATASVIAFYIFIIMIFFLYSIFKKQELSNKNLIIIIFLFSFLSFTHPEETLYFLIIFLFVELFYISFKEENLHPSHFFSRKIRDNSFIKKYCLLFGILILIFYLSQEFLGSLTWYISFFNKLPGFELLNSIYLDSKIISFPFLSTNFVLLSYIVLIITIFIPILLYFIFYLIIFIKSKSVDLGSKINKFLNKIHSFLINSRYKDLFQLLVILFLIGSIAIINFFTYEFLTTEVSLFMILEIIFVYYYYIIQISIFLTNLLFFKLKKLNERFFLINILILLLSFSFFIFSSASIGHIMYEFQKILYLIIFLNMFLIKDNYFNDLKGKKFKYFFIILSIMLFGGLIMSFRKLKFG